MHMPQHRNRNGVSIIAALAIILTMLLAPMSGLARQATPATGGGTMTGAFDVGPGGCPECFNPLQAGAGFTWFEKYFSKLMLYDIDFTKISGELAESWDVSADGTVYTIHLRDGVKWHDGEPFTSNDVKFTIELASNPDSASYIGAKFAGVTTIDTPDPLTAVITLGTANAALLDAFTFLVMLPEHALKDIAPVDLVKSDWWYTNPIGTGPFKWNSYVPGQYVELVANDDYWRGRPVLDKLINRYFPEAGSAVIALRSGEIQFSYLAADEATSLADDATIKQYSGPSQVPNYLGFNLKQTRFQSQGIRQAFMYAIDRATIIDQLYNGSAQPLSCLYSLPQYVPADGLEAYDYNVETAKQMLADGGWDGSSVEILTYYADQLSQDVLTTIQQFLGDAGVTVTLRTADTPTFNQLAEAGTFDITYGGAANGPDPDVMSTHFESKASNPSVLNRSNIADPELDKLFAEGRATIDPAARALVYQQICTIMNQQVYWAPLWISTRFGGTNGMDTFLWTPAPGGGRYYDAAETWTLAS
jgi:peptide/nickel transport system substrate-binding protein